jgi:DNA-directed RNA polymerase subunit RPC12/RpoP
MAVGSRFVCSNCDAEVIAWSDGNPYFIDEHSLKQYAYHPDPNAERCVGVDFPHLCLGCGAKIQVDSNLPTNTCPDCGGRMLIAATQLEGKSCPECHAGKYIVDSQYRAIS